MIDLNKEEYVYVLILVVMEEGQRRPTGRGRTRPAGVNTVLILVVMEEGQRQISPNNYGS